MVRHPKNTRRTGNGMARKKKKLSCKECEARCCRYVATQLDEPDCKRDYDHIRWYLLHLNVFVFMDHEGDWYLEFETDCAALGADSRCTNYDNRPPLCRSHGEGDYACEFRAEERPYKVRFSTAPEFEAWLDKKGFKWRRKKA